MKVSDKYAEEVVLSVNTKNDLPTAYYISKKRQLEYALDQLNVMDHPMEIQRLCGEIVAVKKKIRELELRKKML